AFRLRELHVADVEMVAARRAAQIHPGHGALPDVPEKLLHGLYSKVFPAGGPWRTFFARNNPRGSGSGWPGGSAGGVASCRMDKLGPLLRRLLAVALVLAAGASAGCQSVPESRAKTRSVFENAKLTPFQLRLLVNEFTHRFALRVEGAADQILAGSRSREVSRHALLWKIHGISACFLASSHQDPLGALGEFTILPLQMRRVFEGGAASGAFGPDHPLAVTVSVELEREILQIRSLLSDDQAGLERGLRQLREIADRAPLTDLTFVRAPIVQAFLSRILNDTRGVFEVVGSIDEAVAGLRELVVLQLTHVPKRMRWEAELLLVDLDRAPSLDRERVVEGN